MNKVIGRINKLSPQATILIASIIVGSFYYLTEINKQKYIGLNLEKQNIPAENVARVTEQPVYIEAKIDNTSNRAECVKSAEDRYNRLVSNVMEKGSTGEIKGTEAAQIADSLYSEMVTKKEDCYKIYK